MIWMARVISQFPLMIFWSRSQFEGKFYHLHSSQMNFGNFGFLCIHPPDFMVAGCPSGREGLWTPLPSRAWECLETSGVLRVVNSLQFSYIMFLSVMCTCFSSWNPRHIICTGRFFPANISVTVLAKDGMCQISSCHRWPTSRIPRIQPLSIRRVDWGIRSNAASDLEFLLWIGVCCIHVFICIPQNEESQNRTYFKFWKKMSQLHTSGWMMLIINQSANRCRGP